MSALTKEQIEMLPMMIEEIRAVLPSAGEKTKPFIEVLDDLFGTVMEQQAEIERLRAFIADFAKAKFEQIDNRGRNWRGTEDDEDPVTDWMAVDAWQDDARALLEGKP